MPSATQPFLTVSGTIFLAVSTAPAPVPTSTGSVQGLLLSNLSTSNMVVLISQSSLTTMSTQSTSALVVGIPVVHDRQITVSCPPNSFVSAMTTGTGLTGVLGVSPGVGMV